MRYTVPLLLKFGFRRFGRCFSCRVGDGGSCHLSDVTHTFCYSEIQYQYDGTTRRTGQNVRTRVLQYYTTSRSCNSTLEYLDLLYQLLWYSVWADDSSSTGVHYLYSYRYSSVCEYLYSILEYKHNLLSASICLAQQYMYSE